MGTVQCNFDTASTPTAGHYVINSGTTGGLCLGVATYPTGGQLVGIVTSALGFVGNVFVTTDEASIIAGANMTVTYGGGPQATIATVASPAFSTSVTSPLYTSAGALSVKTPAGASSSPTAAIGINTGPNSGSGGTGGVTIASGSATSSGSSGSVNIDAGSSVGPAGTVQLGTTNASALSIGNGAATTTNAGPFTSAGIITANNNLIVPATSGEVGIGTSAPVAPLTFNTNPGDRIQLYALGGVSRWGFGIGSWELVEYLDGSGAPPSPGRHSWQITPSSGDPTVGGTAFANLYTTGEFDLLLQSASVNALTVKGVASQTGDYFDLTASSGSTGNVFTVKSLGKVGIGTVSPGAQLDVQGGAINSSGGYCIGANCITNWPVPIANGGTGQTAAPAAFNALSPMFTLGDLEYESAANTASRLAGNTSATPQFLQQTGTGSASAAPVWAVPLGGILARSLSGSATATSISYGTFGTASLTTVGSAIKVSIT